MNTERQQKQEIWERLDQGRRAKANDGGYAGYGSPAFGQQSINGELVEDPIECEIIDLIRRHHKSGKSLQKIADWLNQEGYTTKRGQSAIPGINFALEVDVVSEDLREIDDLLIARALAFRQFIYARFDRARNA
ncbi:MAG: hypothetical protein AAGB01_10605, partial [Cyanobacteria bacterium P01_F01_bin.42]